MMKKDKIKLIVFDFDGVMTDNRVTINERGEESVRVNRADGLGVDLLRNAGIPMMIMSTEENPIVLHRAKKLKLFCLSSIKDKAEALRQYCDDQRLNPRTFFMLATI